MWKIGKSMLEMHEQYRNIFLKLISFCPTWQPSAPIFFATEGLSLIKNLTLFFLTIFLIFLDIFNKLWLDIPFNLN